MKRLLQGLIALAVLVALVGWVMQRHELSSSLRQAVLSRPGVIPVASVQKTGLTGVRRTVEDHFATAQILGTREMEIQTPAGEKQVRRVRLVRDASYKYPLLRVEDEMVRTPQGDRLVRQSAMVKRALKAEEDLKAGRFQTLEEFNKDMDEFIEGLYAKKTKAKRRA